MGFLKTYFMVLLRIMLILFGRGRNFSGMEFHVFRPIMTTFLLSGLSVCVVIFLKNSMSFFNLQGSCPSFPIPQSLQAATTKFSFVVIFKFLAEICKHRKRERPKYQWHCDFPKKIALHFI